MNKKVWMGFIAVFIAGWALNWLIHGVLLEPQYKASEWLWRSQDEMMSKYWIMVVTGLFLSFFFTFIFSKGYEGKGLAEGVRYGLYVSLMVMIPAAYNSYVVYKDFPYQLALWWFIYGTIEYIILGVILAWIFGMKPKKAAQAS